jgi:hypothetical protein
LASCNGKIVEILTQIFIFSRNNFPDGQKAGYYPQKNLYGPSGESDILFRAYPARAYPAQAGLPSKYLCGPSGEPDIPFRANPAQA